MIDHDGGGSTPDEPDDRLSRRKLIGGTAVGAAVVWTAQFPFAEVAIGQTIGGADGPTGPTGPTGASGDTGSTGPTTSVPTGDVGSASGAADGTLARTGVDAGALGAVGAAAVAAGGALVWFRTRNADGTPADGESA